MVNQYVNGYTKTLHRRKMLKETQKKQQPAENQKNAETGYKLSGATVFAFGLSGGSDSPLCRLPSVNQGVGKPFRTADRFQSGIYLRTGPQ